MADSSILDKLDSIAPIQQFDAFPKLPNTYKSRTAYGGIITIIVGVISFVMILNDLGEYLWGWSDHEFAVDSHVESTLNMNVDLVVNMPCHYLMVDLRDAVGDRLYLSNAFHRDGTTFDVGQAATLRDHAMTLDARQMLAAAKRSRPGFFSFWSKKETFRPTYNHVPDADACRIYGSVHVKKVTGNLHITTLGHGYASHEHTDHSKMNLTHLITEFSFGPYFPEIVQPLDYSLEVATNPFTAFQYFITVVPTTYYAGHSKPLETNQYSVTSYSRSFDHGHGVPGLFFKFEIDPMAIAVHQRTTSLLNFLIRVVGVVGGVWVCAGWGFKITNKAVEVVVGPSDDGQIVSEAKTSARKNKWFGGDLNRRKSGWGSGNGNGSGGSTPGTPYLNYAGTPHTPSFGPASPFASSPHLSVYGTSPYPPTSPSSYSRPPSYLGSSSPAPYSPGANGNGNGNGNGYMNGNGSGSEEFVNPASRVRPPLTPLPGRKDL